MKKIPPRKQPTGELYWPDLTCGTLIKRYKRFLADVRLETGEIVTAHCANSGSMRQCAEPNRTVYLSRHDNPKRKLKYTWELIEMPESLVGVNTMVPNRLVEQSIRADRIQEVLGYDRISREVKVGNSRLDLRLTQESGPDCFIEIKNCTLVENGEASFPDAVTTRGRKHLTELQQLVKNGNRCVMFFLIQRMDAKRFTPADRIDPAYGTELRKAFANQVEIVVYDVSITLDRIAIGKRIPFIL